MCLPMPTRTYVFWFVSNVEGVDPFDVAAFESFKTG
jgi:hypothetical protein